MLRAMLISIGLSCALWLVFNFLPVTIHILRGRATGVAFHVPRAFQGLPRPLQISAILFGIPILIGCLVGGCWYLLSRAL
jgi:hypothetical protein